MNMLKRYSLYQSIVQHLNINAIRGTIGRQFNPCLQIPFSNSLHIGPNPAAADKLWQLPRLEWMLLIKHIAPVIGQMHRRRHRLLRS